MPRRIRMIRESDEECLALIAEVRDRDAFEQPLGDPPKSQADLEAEAEEDRQRSAIKAHWRQLIREEVRKQVEQELAPVCESITQVEQSIFVASSEIGAARKVTHDRIREEVAAEVHSYRAEVLGDAFRRRRVPPHQPPPPQIHRDPPRLSAVDDEPS